VLLIDKLKLAQSTGVMEYAYRLKKLHHNEDAN